MPRKVTKRETVSEQNQRHLVSETFEERTTATLQSQDRILERLEDKLDAPVFNGGFENLVNQVEKIKTVQEQMKESSMTVGKQVSDIHAVIYDPEKGIYLKVKEHGTWIDKVKGASKWILALLITLSLTGVGKLIYDFASGHIRFSP